MIPVNEPVLGAQEAENVAECMRTGWISSAGQYIERFEQDWASYCDMPHGIAVSNGTAALDVAVQCINIGPGDEVIMPSFTIISCAQAVTLHGGVPVLVDADPLTWCMDVTQVEARITPRTRAIMPVHIYGHPVDMDPLWQLAAHYGLTIIEDAAEVHGAEYLAGHGTTNAQWRRCGGLGDISTFSFYANKLITTGEGGMVLARQSKHAERARSLRNLCFQQRRYVHEEIGQNYRLTNLQAAIGVAQIPRMPEIIARKRWMAGAYQSGLADLSVLQLPCEMPWARQVYWMYGLVLDEASGMTAAEFAARLKGAGIDTRAFFWGMHEQPVFLNQGLFAGEHYPVTERLARQGLYLPSGLALTQAQVDRVVEAVHEVLA